MATVTERALVHIVDDSADVRDSLRMLLDCVGIESLGYGSADEFLDRYNATPGQPACLLLDVRLPGHSGIQLLEKLREDRTGIPVILLTAHGDIPMSVRAMKLGAVDFLTKPYDPQSLLDLVQSVLNNPELQGHAEPATFDPLKIGEHWNTLSPREQEVFEFIATGASNKATAIDLGISIRTVETHRANIMKKLQLHSLVDLVLVKQYLKGSG